MIKQSRYACLILGVSSLLLSACSENSDLVNWVNEEKAKAIKAHPEKKIPSINAMIKYTPPIFTGLYAFNPERLKAGRQAGGVEGPSGNRPKEILENFSLENVEYVGSMEKSGQTIGFVRVDGHIYTVHHGNYLGQDFGKIVAIEPDRIVLQELVESTEGEWQNREGAINRSDSIDARK